MLNLNSRKHHSNAVFNSSAKDFAPKYLKPQNLKTLLPIGDCGRILDAPFGSILSSPCLIEWSLIHVIKDCIKKSKSLPPI
jgi:hypothetical protein